MLWAECPHLGSGLVAELEAKHAIVKKLAREGKHGRTRFISAEGCYSWVVAHATNLRVRFASKAFADWSDNREFYVVDGAVRKCARPEQVWQPDGGGGSSGVNGSCFPFSARIARHSLSLPGVQRPSGPTRQVVVHAECSRCVKRRAVYAHVRMHARCTQHPRCTRCMHTTDGSSTATGCVPI